MKIRLIIAISAGFVLHGQAQDNTPSPYPEKPKYSHAYLMGISVGESTSSISGSVLTIQGVGYRKFNFGVGSGLDAYDGWRVVPVFASLTYHFPRYDVKNVGLYMQLNAGHSFGWQTTKAEWIEYDDPGGGLMLNPMMGYRIFKETINLYIQLGYKYQRLQHSSTQTFGTTTYYYDQEYTFERFFVQLGFGF